MDTINHIDISGLEFSYDENKAILDNLSLKVSAGEKIALVGPNGSGKTTLFFLLCGVLKPVQGTILVAGKEVRPNSFNKDIAYLFQSPDDQLFNATIFDDVAFGPTHIGLSKEDVFKRSQEALYKTGIWEHREKSPHHLSGGEKRLAAIATLIAMEPRIYLFDEPTANLDCKNRRSTISLIQNVTETMLISSHDLEFLLEVCDRCILVDTGSIIADGPIREILSNEVLLSKHHLEKPHSLIPHKHYL